MTAIFIAFLLFAHSSRSPARPCGRRGSAWPRRPRSSRRDASERRIRRNWGKTGQTSFVFILLSFGFEVAQKSRERRFERIIVLPALEVRNEILSNLNPQVLAALGVETLPL